MIRLKCANFDMVSKIMIAQTSRNTIIKNKKIMEISDYLNFSSVFLYIHQK